MALAFEPIAFQTASVPQAFQGDAGHVCPTPNPRASVTPANSRSAVTAATPREC